MRTVVLVSVLAVAPVPVAAQSDEPAADAASADTVDYLSRFAFHFGAERLWDEDPRFVWDANYGGEVDLVDFRRGRATFYANYQVILGDELRAFDPNQANYILGFRVSARLPAFEAAVVFHHESRHLSDRSKEMPVDWNMLGARLNRSFAAGRSSFEASADIRGVIQQSFVDYEWEVDGRLGSRFPLTSRVSFISEVTVHHVGVDGSADRGGQTGVRGVAGVRLSGKGAAVELYVAAERRIDPYPLEFGTGQWVSAGFRFVNP